MCFLLLTKFYKILSLTPFDWFTDMVVWKVDVKKTILFVL